HDGYGMAVPVPAVGVPVAVAGQQPDLQAVLLRLADTQVVGVVQHVLDDRQSFAGERRVVGKRRGHRVTARFCSDITSSSTSSKDTSPGGSCSRTVRRWNTAAIAVLTEARSDSATPTRRNSCDHALLVPEPSWMPSLGRVTVAVGSNSRIASRSTHL